MEIIISIIAISLGFLVQSMIGFAAAYIALPILLFVVDIREANILISFFYFAFSLFLVPKNWRDVDRQIFKQMFVSLIFGTVLGVYLLKVGNPIYLKKILGVFLITYVAYSYFSKNKKIEAISRLGHVLGFGGGVVSGLFSAGGALIIPYINNQLTNPRNIRATIIGVMGVINFARVPLFFYNKLMSYDIFMNALIIFPFFLLSLFLGQKIFDKVNAKTFKNILLFLLMISGILLIVR